MDWEIPPVLGVLIACAIIPLAVYGLFLLGDKLGLKWYVSAVSILLIGRFLFGVMEHWG